MRVSVGTHVAALVGLATPLAVAQLSYVAMSVTDTVLLGSLGPDALAAGGFANQVALTLGVMLQGVLQSVSVLAAQALGGGGPVAGVAATGLVLALLLSVPDFAGLSAASWLLAAAGEPAGLVTDVDRYLGILRWGAPASFVGIGLMRALLPALGHGRLILYVAIGAAIVNGLLNYGLIHGVGPLPELGFLGSATATNITLFGTVVVLAWLLVRQRVWPELRRGRPDRAVLAEMLRLGVPVGATYGVETGVFLAVGLMMGRLGPAALAAHQIVLNVAITSFMIPLALSQAVNVRVGFFIGAGAPQEARRAGFIAIGVAALFMASAGVLLATLPDHILRLYLDPARAGPVFGIALSLVAVAAVFQVADGVQTVASGALRGLKDTRVPFLIATFGYWVVGFGVAAGLAFGAGWGAPGLWWGLAAGLAVVAVLMTFRFGRMSRVGAS